MSPRQPAVVAPIVTVLVDMQRDADVLIIGCGPAGSTAATFLARTGRRVIVLERDAFPRFRIGESLLPYNRALFEEMGVWPALQAAGFPRKTGAQFHLIDGARSRRFTFKHGAFTRHRETIQVERARFDHLLMQHARQVGADVREGWPVERFHAETDAVTVEAQDPAGRPHRLRASFLIDASGRANLTANQQQLRRVHPRHRKVAIFSHFTGVPLDEGEPGGDTVIVWGGDHWFWLIPISDRKTSVGLVLDAREVAPGADGEQVFQSRLAGSPCMQKYLAGARPLMDIKTTADFSYFNQRLVDARVVRVGDAAGFMDPIFSGGVYLAMWGGKLAAQALSTALQQRSRARRILSAYERRLRRAMNVYWRLVEYYYTPAFMEVFLEPRDNLKIPAAVLAVLAGEWEPPWPVRWRLELFYLLVRLQKWRPFAPRLPFPRPTAEPGAATQA